jgi:hypothetical protein
MRGPTEAAGTRWLPSYTRRGLSGWIADIRHRRRRNSVERLEVIARLASEERRARRAGEYVPNAGTRRIW